MCVWLVVVVVWKWSEMRGWFDFIIALMILLYSLYTFIPVVIVVVVVYSYINFRCKKKLVHSAQLFIILLELKGIICLSRQLCRLLQDFLFLCPDKGEPRVR